MGLNAGLGRIELSGRLMGVKMAGGTMGSVEYGALTPMKDVWKAGWKNEVS